MRALLSMRSQVSYKSKRKELTWILSSVVAAALAGCGGGGGGGSAPGAAPDSAVGVTTGQGGSSGGPPPGGAATTPVTAAGTSPVFADCDMFPSNAIFNTRIDDTARFPAHVNSNAWISLVGGSIPF